MGYFFNKMETTWCITWIREEREREKKGQTCLFRLIHRRTRRDITSISHQLLNVCETANGKHQRAGLSHAVAFHHRLDPRFPFVFWRKKFAPARGSVSAVRASFLPKKREGEKKNPVAERANKLARVQGLLIVWKMSCLAQEDCVARNYTPTTDNTADASATRRLYLYLFLFFKEWPNIR